MLAQLFALLPLLAIASASPIDKRATGQLIRVGRNPGQCLSVDGGRDTVSNGRVHDATGVVSQSCDTASLWDISRGSGSVIVSGTKYALDIGLNPGNNGNLKACLLPSSLQDNADGIGMDLIPRCTPADLVLDRRQPDRSDWR